MQLSWQVAVDQSLTVSRTVAALIEINQYYEDSRDVSIYNRDLLKVDLI